MMKGKRLIGLIIAGVLLVFVVCVLVFGGEEPAVWLRPGGSMKFLGVG